MLTGVGGAGTCQESMATMLRFMPRTDILFYSPGWSCGVYLYKPNRSVLCHRPVMVQGPKPDVPCGLWSELPNSKTATCTSCSPQFAYHLNIRQPRRERPAGQISLLPTALVRSLDSSGSKPDRLISLLAPSAQQRPRRSHSAIPGYPYSIAYQSLR